MNGQNGYKGVVLILERKICPWRTSVIRYWMKTRISQQNTCTLESTICPL